MGERGREREGDSGKERRKEGRRKVELRIIMQIAKCVPGLLDRVSWWCIHCVVPQSLY